MSIEFQIKKMYTKISEEEFDSGVAELNNEEIKNNQTVKLLDGREFPPFIYEHINDQSYRFDGYDIITIIDGYENNDFVTPNNTAIYYMNKEKANILAENALNMYNSLLQSDEKEAEKYLQKYEKFTQSVSFYTSLLEALHNAE